MITAQELNILMQESTRDSIERNIDRTPTDIALDRRVENSALVATQVKYLQRAKSKLPSYFEARCIIPSLAFEQSSSEATASTKTISGESLLELTCGLGVDTFHLSKRFDRVTTIERNEILAEVARENFRRLGASNVEVITASSEDFLANCNQSFDWIYADPDRRSDEGRKLVRLEDCSPNMLSIKERLNQISRIGTMIKCSPIFDVDEAFRLYEGADVEVVSLHDECKEVVIIARKNSSTQHIIVTPIQHAISTLINCEQLIFIRSEIDNIPSREPFIPEQYKWLIIPDVSLQKSRTAVHALRGVADIWSNNGFGFSSQKPTSKYGRVFEIDEVTDFRPKELNKRLAKRGVEILKRDFEIPQNQITKQLKLKSGAEIQLALTTIEGRNLAIFLKR
ncbi:MAG: methyltransferase domain-containing protein [Rikenellaceae bacterium]